jgi:PKD repeat protein
VKAAAGAVAIAVALAAAVPSALGVSGSDTIKTVAGIGLGGFAGDGGQATSALLNRPRGIAVDRRGNVYVADENNQRIRKLSAGTITTIAGTGVAGFSGDGGQATSAELEEPIDVAVDSRGAVYIADALNNRIRRVSGGTITTVAGTGVAGFSGDGGEATSARLDQPFAVAVDGRGDVFIADAGNNRIRKVSGGTITTVAGTGTAGFSGDGGQATRAQLARPSGVAVDDQGDLYIADTGNYRIRKVSGGVITTVAGTGASGSTGDGSPATSARIGTVYSLEVDRMGSVYLADFSNNRIRKVGGGVITTLAGSGTPGFTGDGGPADGAQLSGPLGVGLDGQGDLYLADTSNERVREIANRVPTASIRVSRSSGRLPLRVRLDATGSSDPDGRVVKYAWTFGDGTTTASARPSHTYRRPGSFTLRLTVTDDSGATGTASRTIRVRR